MHQIKKIRQLGLGHLQYGALQLHDIIKPRGHCHWDLRKGQLQHLGSPFHNYGDPSWPHTMPGEPAGDCSQDRWDSSEEKMDPVSVSSSRYSFFTGPGAGPREGLLKEGPGASAGGEEKAIKGCSTTASEAVVSPL